MIFQWASDGKSMKISIYKLLSYHRNLNSQMRTQREFDEDSKRNSRWLLIEVSTKSRWILIEVSLRSQWILLGLSLLSPWVLVEFPFDSQCLYRRAETKRKAKAAHAVGCIELHGECIIWVHRGCAWLHMVCCWLHRGCIWLQRGCIWFHGLYLAA